MKTSPYKERILAEFGKAHTLSIAGIHKIIPQADFSTIFRNVERLLKGGVLKKIIVDADTSVYELVKAGQVHDHFICIDCGTVDEIHIEKTDLKGLGKARVADIVIRGICARCVTGKKKTT